METEQATKSGMEPVEESKDQPKRKALPEHRPRKEIVRVLFGCSGAVGFLSHLRALPRYQS